MMNTNKLRSETVKPPTNRDQGALVATGTMNLMNKLRSNLRDDYMKKKLVI